MKNFARESLLSSDQPSARMFVWPLEMMLRFNASIANAIQESTVSWAQRRQEAADNAVETFERLVHCQDLGEAVSIQQEWVENNIRRLDQDFGALTDQGANLSHRAASTARDAVGKSSHAARAGARQIEERAEALGREGEEAEQSARHESGGSRRRGHGRARNNNNNKRKA
jgi:hypothetical protein